PARRSKLPRAITPPPALFPGPVVAGPGRAPLRPVRARTALTPGPWTRTGPVATVPYVICPHGPPAVPPGDSRGREGGGPPAHLPPGRPGRRWGEAGPAGACTAENTRLGRRDSYPASSPLSFKQPHLHGPLLTSAHDTFPVGAEGHALHPARVPDQGAQLLAAAHVPDPDRPVLAAADQSSPVGAEGQAGHAAVMPRQRPLLAPALRVPQ